MTIDLDRFLKAQNHVYLNALQEIQNGKKKSHWMWYVFPQIVGLGHSDTSKFYAIQNLQEASAFLKHPVLGENLKAVSNALIDLSDLSAYDIFGSPDDLKLNSCMTLFSQVTSDSDIFGQVLDKYFAGKLDQKTIDILHNIDKSNSADIKA
ncbi:DUF1810 domain-containing protein [Sphingobacterium chungjuense]|uniref:DUF1810 domain-containing protein n=1 Tax=Sphingobacterium chungjuense TaxID=2675553 RepID=UPI00140C0DF1|nr:DUF1810 domain-containing protein [Sphingobacterium chungjuense]